MRAVLDIEGTVCPISFVKETLYPYAINKSKQLIPKIKFPINSSRSEIEKYLANFPKEYSNNSTEIIAHIEDLTKNDIKAPYLKALQGYLWKFGYDNGEIKVDLFPDVPAALARWNTQVDGLYIYSSGSIAAQKLLFANTSTGDLNHYFKGYFDTTTAGPKVEKHSYEVIAKSFGVDPHEIMFFSDNSKEILAASSAGWHTTWVVRPGNVPEPTFIAPENTVRDFEFTAF